MRTQIYGTISHRMLYRWLSLLVIGALCLVQIRMTGQTVVQAAEQPAPAMQGRVAIVNTKTATLFAAPGAEAITALATGESVQASGRSADGQWVYVTTDDGTSGWTPATDLVLFGLNSLPILAVTVTESAASPAPTINEAASSAASPTPSPTPLATLEADNTAVESRPTIEVMTGNARLNVRTGPGTVYAVMAKVESGQQLVALARNGASDWVQIELTDGKPGWVSTSYVQLSIPPAELPLAADIPALPVGSEQLAVNSNQSSEASTQPAATGQTAATMTTGSTGLTGKLVFSMGNGGLFYLYDLATSELRALTSGYDPALSPDGTQVAFTRVGGENGLYVINIDGSGERKIFGERDLLSSPKWSPDGQWIVFSSSKGTYECYQLGRSCRTLTELRDSNPALADPQVADQFFKDVEVIENNVWALSRVNPNGDDYRDIAAMDTARTPDWSEGGIVYQSTGGIQKTADTPDAENQAVVAEHYVHDPDWQPGGGRIVYQMRRGSHWEIFAVNPDGSGNAVLTRPVTTLVDQLPSNVSPAWSPDGQHIVFLSNREENHEAGVWRIWVMNADGSDQHPLAIDVPLVYNYTGEQMVDWAR